MGEKMAKQSEKTLGELAIEQGMVEAILCSSCGVANATHRSSCGGCGAKFGNVEISLSLTDTGIDEETGEQSFWGMSSLAKRKKKWWEF